MFAIDAAGLRSTGAISNGFIPDITFPIDQRIAGYGANVITNPSFEIVYEEPLDTFLNMTDEAVTKARPLGWEVFDGSRCAVVTSIDVQADDGVSVLALYGQISQTIVTSVGMKYELTLSVSHMPFIRSVLNQEGRIEAPGLKQVFVLYNKPPTVYDDTMSTMWQRHVFHFTADSDESTIVISSLGQANGFLLDTVEVCIH